VEVTDDEADDDDAGGDDGGGGSGAPNPMSDYYHGPIKKGEADELLLADGGEAVSGKFLFRQKGKSENDYILSVVYKKSATHHAVVRAGEGAEFTLNKNPTGSTDLAGVAEFCKKKTKKWPVKLVEGVIGLPNPNGGGSGGGGGGPNPLGTFFHGKLKKAEADQILLADGGEGVNGKFLFRSKADPPGNDFILSVIYKKKPSHHTVARAAEGEEFTLNKNPTGKATLIELAEHLNQKRPKWPVPLTKGVPGLDLPGLPGGGGGGGGGGPKVKKYKKVKKIVKRTITKRVKKEVDPNDPRFKDEPESNLIRSDSGLLGFEDWNPEENVAAARAKVDAGDSAYLAENKDQADATPKSPHEMSDYVEPTHRTVQNHRVKKRWITKTWRKKKLQELAGGHRPSVFGDFGNLVSKSQAAAMANNRVGGSLHSAVKVPRPSAQAADLFKPVGQLLSQSGLALAGASQNRMQASFMSFGGQQEPAQFADVPVDDSLLNQECTFLGNCTCPDCRGW